MKYTFKNGSGAECTELIDDVMSKSQNSNLHSLFTKLQLAKQNKEPFCNADMGLDCNEISMVQKDKFALE